MRRGLLSAVLAFAGIAALFGSGWALQAAALPPPKPAARVAADASAWFHNYRLAIDTFHFDERRSQGACLRGWFGRRNGQKVRGSLISFQQGPILRVSGKTGVSVVTGRLRRRLPPGLLAFEVGCSRALAGALAAAAQSGHLTSERAFSANRPAIALEAQRGPDKGRLTVFVSPRSARPLVAFVGQGSRMITARIYLQPASRRVLRQFGLLQWIRPVQKR